MNTDTNRRNFQSIVTKMDDQSQTQSQSLGQQSWRDYVLRGYCADDLKTRIVKNKLVSGLVALLIVVILIFSIALGSTHSQMSQMQAEMTEMEIALRASSGKPSEAAEVNPVEARDDDIKSPTKGSKF